MSDVKAAGRSKQRVPFMHRLGLFFALSVLFLEVLLQAAIHHVHLGPLVKRLAPLVPLVQHYAHLRGWVLRHPVAAACILVVLVSLALLFVRWALLFWHNKIVARLSGTHFEPPTDIRPVEKFPLKRVDLIAQIGRRPLDESYPRRGKHLPRPKFVGLSPSRGLLGLWNWKPVYISPRQQTMHRHVIGKTGSGKTASILWPSVLQDALDGKGILVMDAKGSDENIRIVKAIAQLAGRTEQLRVFALPAWNQPRLPSGRYNMVYVRPAGAGDDGGDPVATAERVFSILQLGDNDYYNTQAEIMFVNLCKLLHDMVDEQGAGLPFVMMDLAVCFKGCGANGPWTRALDFCLRESRDREAAREIESQLARLGNDVKKCFSGVIGAIDRFLSPLVNAYDPDIRFDEVLEQNLIVYAQLPANLFKLQAPAMGRVMLMDVQQEGSLRQVFRDQRNQTPFSVTVDEFYNFADPTIIDSLNKLRDANLEFTLAHQSIADLEIISKEFAVCTWDNTRTKDILNQDNPDLCEKLAQSVGTDKVVEKTIRTQRGALFTSLVTGAGTMTLGEGYRLHPNAIKGLASCGQGYLYNDEGIRAVSYGLLPPGIEADFSLPQKDQSTARGLRLYERFIAAEERRRAPDVSPRR
jgi:hypothetical protein